ncbi:MAG: S1 RNA-binding domain-containing protein, partial [Acidimicrobiia bacterium]
MSNELETAPVGTPDEETAQTPETPETPVSDTEVEETTTADPTPETPTSEEAPQDPAADVPVDEGSAAEPPADEAPNEESGAKTTPFQHREALVAPDLSELPDDIGDDFERAIDITVLKFKEGDIVEGSIVSIDAEGAMVDVGYKSEGLIPTRELSIRNNIDPNDVVEIGERVEAVVLDMEDDEGRMILSKKRAMYERAWGRIQKISEEDGTVEGTVIEVVKGGLIVDIGIRGFLPASLVDLRRVRDLDQFIGQPITAKVIELDRARNNVVLSRRAHLEEALAEERNEFLENLAEG